MNKKQNDHKRRKRSIVVSALIFFLTAISFLALFSAIWYIRRIGDIGFASILYTLLSGMQGTDSGIIAAWVNQAAIPAALSTIGICAVLIMPFPKNGWGINIPVRGNKKRIILYPFSNLVSSIIAVVLSAAILTTALVSVGFPQWLKAMSDKSTLYEDEYADPDKVSLTFPEQKRNLIYILLESMETSYLSEKYGGAMQYNLISNLYKLAENNVSFSHNDGIGGWGQISNTEWTMAAIIAQTAGIPLTVPIYGNNLRKYDRVLPGLTTITDILHENGYYQTLMVGSDAGFAGRDKYYLQHGTDHVYDLFTARADGIVPSGYHDGWWGIEDMYLYEYAKQELSEISKNDQPFAFTLLTVDTHAYGGHSCELCDPRYSTNYDKVINCADKQVDKFIDWIKGQDFYENTTIVICGDHLSMDKSYFEKKLGGKSYNRTVYNCIINSTDAAVNEKNRVFTPMDMFPTTLSAMGIEIEGDRLGLGTDMFSDTPTLAEEYGLEELNSLLVKNSTYYMTNFFLD